MRIEWVIHIKPPLGAGTVFCSAGLMFDVWLAGLLKEQYAIFSALNLKYWPGVCTVMLMHVNLLFFPSLSYQLSISNPVAINNK